MKLSIPAVACKLEKLPGYRNNGWPGTAMRESLRLVYQVLLHNESKTDGEETLSGGEETLSKGEETLTGHKEYLTMSNAPCHFPMEQLRYGIRDFFRVIKMTGKLRNCYL